MIGGLLLLAWALVATVVAVRTRAALVAEIAARARLADSFSRHFSPQVAELLARHGPSALAAGRREVSILFADLSGFTRYAETHAAEAVVATVGQYLDELSRVALQRGGTIDKFMGDEVMVLFNAPLPQPDHAARALATARDMQLVTALLNDARHAAGQPELGLSIGVNSGEAVLGSIGSESRVQYTVIGDAVNVAKRLQGKAKAGEIVVGARTLTLAGEGAPLEELTLKNRGAAVWAARFEATH